MSAPSLPFRSPRITLQTRILALFLALMVAVQVGGFLLVNSVGTNAARATIGDELIAGEQVFVRALHQERLRLVQGARLLAADYAFREAIATGDRGTIASVLVNHGKRIDSDLTMLIGLDGNVIAGGESARYPRGNHFPGSLLEVRFADQPGGNYRLADGSRYRKGPGKDAGVDVDALVAAGAVDAGGRGPR